MSTGLLGLHRSSMPLAQQAARRRKLRKRGFLNPTAKAKEQADRTARWNPKAKTKEQADRTERVDERLQSMGLTSKASKGMRSRACAQIAEMCTSLVEMEVDTTTPAAKVRMSKEKKDESYAEDNLEELGLTLRTLDIQFHLLDIKEDMSHMKEEMGKLRQKYKDDFDDLLKEVGELRHTLDVDADTPLATLKQGPSYGESSSDPGPMSVLLSLSEDSIDSFLSGTLSELVLQTTTQPPAPTPPPPPPSKTPSKKSSSQRKTSPLVAARHKNRSQEEAQSVCSEQENIQSVLDDIPNNLPKLKFSKSRKSRMERAKLFTRRL